MMLIQRVQRFIEAHHLLQKDGGVLLVALSGGADSVCLFLMLRKLGYQVEAVHCNFHLRGEESNRDEQFVIQLCEANAVKLHLTHFDTKFYAELHKVSIEMAARELRYAYFEQLRHDLSAQAVCVAHHQDDSVETILMNLLRGTGLEGLAGIKPRNGYIVRPLLCINRQEIEAWLAELGQKYVTDSTNLVADVIRNQLRLNVIPQLRNVMPSAISNILATAQHLSEAKRVYDAALHNIVEKLNNDHSIAISKLLDQPSPECVLFEWLSPVGFNSATIEQIAQRLAVVQAGRQWLSETHQLIVHAGRLVLCERQAERPTMRFPEPGLYIYDETEHFRISLSKEKSILRHPKACCLDAKKVQFPLTLRPVLPGDRFQPFGMRGSKLVCDFLTDRKVSIVEKHRQLVLTDANGNILWLVDHRPDGRFTIDSETHQMLLIQHDISL